jgi:hypothetical protein
MIKLDQNTSTLLGIIQPELPGTFLATLQALVCQLYEQFIHTEEANAAWFNHCKGLISAPPVTVSDGADRFRTMFARMLLDGIEYPLYVGSNHFRIQLVDKTFVGRPAVPAIVLEYMSEFEDAFLPHGPEYFFETDVLRALDAMQKRRVSREYDKPTDLGRTPDQFVNPTAPTPTGKELTKFELRRINVTNRLSDYGYTAVYGRAEDKSKQVICFYLDLYEDYRGRPDGQTRHAYRTAAEAMSALAAFADGFAKGITVYSKEGTLLYKEFTDQGYTFEFSKE